MIHGSCLWMHSLWFPIHGWTRIGSGFGLQVGQSLLPFGQGARNGAFVFLGIPLKQGKAAAQYYERDLVQTSSWYRG